jgi:peptidoglycan L-alanyl-D-glutamate endopeptidase CwlK
MEDKVTLDRIQLLHPALRTEVEHIYRAQIVPALTGRAICRLAYTLRTFAEQDTLYAQGRTKLFDSKGNRLGIVTKAKGGQSLHNYGLALDIVLIVDNKSASWNQVLDYDKDGKPDWMEAVKIFKSNGWEWGGDWKFKDSPHFQKTFGHSWKDLSVKHKNKDFISGTNYVNL